MRAVSFSTYNHFISPPKKKGLKIHFCCPCGLDTSWILWWISQSRLASRFNQPSGTPKNWGHRFGKEFPGNKNPCLWRGNDVIWCNPKPWMEWNEVVRFPLCKLCSYYAFLSGYQFVSLILILDYHTMNYIFKHVPRVVCALCQVGIALSAPGSTH